MNTKVKHALAAIIAVASLQFSHTAFALTQEECQIRRESLDLSLATYKASVAQHIADLFRARSRFARSTQIVLNRRVTSFVIAKNAEFNELCPDYVYPQP